MHLTIEELIRYTDGERAKWERWFAEHGDAPLKFPTRGGACETVGALVMHIFGPELQYTEFLRGAPLTDYTTLPTDSAAELFAFGRRSRDSMRAWSAGADDWERRVEPREEFPVTARKVTAHVLMHEIRHWAQLALVVRQNGLAPPGDHDLLFSEALD